MVKNKIHSLLLSFSLVLLIPSSVSGQATASWQNWLEEVDPIITKAERELFEDLKTQEDRTRFINSFWKARDPDLQTPQNEYKLEYYERLAYARKRLRGIKSDRGRIYMILGKPFETSSYSGVEQVVECELWRYHAEERPGLPPVFTLIFFRRGDFGDYELFYPGMHNAKDIFAPGFQSGRTSTRIAYTEIKRTFPELAQATLSVIPGEGSPNMPASASSSNQVFAQIFKLPEKEAASNYLRNFRSIEGMVDVTYSFNELGGSGQISLSENRGYRFLNYAAMPEVIRTRNAADNLHMANLQVTMRIADLEGRTVYQKERQMELRLTDLEHKNVEERKAMFRDFAPIIEGDFEVSIVIVNKTTEEFFNHVEKIRISDFSVPVIVGYQAEEAGPDQFLPFSTDRYVISSDPRMVFNKTDSLVGLVFAEEKPQVQLVHFEDEQDVVVIEDIVKQGHTYLFRHPLEDMKSSHYHLIVKHGSTQIYENIIGVLPFMGEKPVWFDWPDPITSGHAYTFELAQQYLNVGDTDAAIEHFNKLPPELWNATTLPFIARAYYRKQDYAKVIDLLERDIVITDYSVLFLLGNSSLELKRLEKAAEYFELLRNYGDTVKINQVLGAIFLSLGEGERAKVYFDRAKKLLNDPEIKKEA